MKRYFNDEGYVQYTISDRDLLTRIANHVSNDQTYFTADRHKVADIAHNLIYEYDIHKSLGNMGGGLTVEEWQYTPEETDLETIIKEHLFEFIGQGYLPKDFVSAAWGAMCEIQLNFQL